MYVCIYSISIFIKKDLKFFSMLPRLFIFICNHLSVIHSNPELNNFIWVGKIFELFLNEIILFYIFYLFFNI